MAGNPLAYPLETTRRTALSRGLVLLMAVSCGISVANLYYSQPLLADIARTFHTSARDIGFVSMLTQIGYAVGMLLFIPLGDTKERRGLIVTLLIAVGLSLLAVATAASLPWLYAASFAVGVTTVAPQMIIPLAAQMAAPEERGKVIGNIMSGLLIGILLARTLAGFVGDWLDWRAMYLLAAVMMAVLAAVLRKMLPASYPDKTMTYGKLMKSLGSLIAGQRTLREASLIGALMFGSFSVFWTALTFYLEGPNYGYGSEVAGLFGLVGVVGAGAASLIGRASDRVDPKWMVGFAILTGLLSFCSFRLFGSALWGLIIGVILLDLGVQGGQVSNQTRIYALLPDARSRLNTVYMVTSFVGGSLGSSFGTFAWSLWGWPGVCAVGGSLTILAFLVWLVHRIVR
ncbi:MFS transporter [Paenibacillus humicola]|uniref:MFS transporter n=1 Tax=Paenibacillus humicola TaxID=3110540 RepID=UPI00237A91F3|nr:MFS transporter [Paenibacillus humicola]